MTEHTIYGHVSDGEIRIRGTTYSGTANGVGITDIDTTANQFEAGQFRFSDTSWWSQQLFLAFDTSVIGPAEIIDTVEFFLDNNGGGGNPRDNIVEARAYDWGASLTAANWQDPTEFGALDLLASVAGTGWVPSLVPFASEPGFVDAINPLGVTRFMVGVSHHRLGVEPLSNDEAYNTRSGNENNVNRRPRLVVNTSPRPPGAAVHIGL